MVFFPFLQKSVPSRIPVGAGHDHGGKPGHHQLPDRYEGHRVDSDHQGNVESFIYFFFKD